MNVLECLSYNTLVDRYLIYDKSNLQRTFLAESASECRQTILFQRDSNEQYYPHTPQGMFVEPQTPQRVFVGTNYLFEPWPLP